MVKINKAKKNSEDTELKDDVVIEDNLDLEEDAEDNDSTEQELDGSEAEAEDQSLDAENDGVIINTVIAEETPAEVTDGKRVRVHMAVDHRCNIGGEWYVLRAGEKPLVPENVRDILLGAGLLLPL